MTSPATMIPVPYAIPERPLVMENLTPSRQPVLVDVPPRKFPAIEYRLILLPVDDRHGRWRLSPENAQLPFARPETRLLHRYQPTTDNAMPEQGIPETVDRGIRCG